MATSVRRAGIVGRVIVDRAAPVIGAVTGGIGAVPALARIVLIVCTAPV